jgi:hypothetical protein
MAVVLEVSKKTMALAVAVLVCISALLFWLSSRASQTPSSEMLQEVPEYSILIQIDEKRLYLLHNGALVKKFPIATGRPGYPSPIGDWKIQSKGGKWGQGFGARWMGLNVSWGLYGIHGTSNEGSVGHDASHGCIRMRNKDVVELYNLVQVGTPVAIRNGVYGPFGTGFKKLLPGDRGADVLAVQKKLKELGYFIGNENGIYGEDTKTALHQFQRDSGLKVENAITHEDYETMGFQEFD